MGRRAEPRSSCKGKRGSWSLVECQRADVFRAVSCITRQERSFSSCRADDSLLLDISLAVAWWKSEIHVFRNRVLFEHITDGLREYLYFFFVLEIMTNETLVKQ